MSGPVWSCGRGLLRRWLAGQLPRTDWTREFLCELDHDLERQAASGTGLRLTLWYVRQLLSPATIGFVRATRARRRKRAAPIGIRLGAGLGNDVRQAGRALVRDPWAACLATLTLAVGIGSVTAMHGLAQRLFLSGPAHVDSPERLQRVFLTFDDAGGRRTSMWIPYRTATAIRDGVDAFERASIYRLFDGLADFGERTRPVYAGEVDANYFGVLGPTPVAGRFLAPDDASAVVLSVPVAFEQFGSPEAALGRTIRVEDFIGEVVGVAPAGFAGPDIDRVDLWIPVDQELALSRNWWTIGRLREASGRAAAVAEAEGIHQAVDPGRSFRWAQEGRLDMSGLRDGPTGERSLETSIAGLLLGVVGLVLVICWGNVLNLLLAGVARRRSEMLVRLALGSGRLRLTRLFAVESLALSLIGGVLSFPLAYAEIALVRGVLLPDVAWESSVLSVDLMLVTLLAVFSSGMLLGLLTARRVDRTDLSGGLAEARQGGSRRTQALLAAGQVTLSAALLLCAGLFVKSFWTMRVTNLGVDAADVHVVNLRSLDFTLGGGAEEEEAQYALALEALRRADTRSLVAHSVGLPFFTNFGMSVHLDGRDSIPELPGGGPFVSQVSSDYFETIGTRIVRGVGITERDVATGARVTVVGSAAAEALWPDGAALDRCVHLGERSDACYRVVGVAEDVHRRGYREPPSMQFYLPLGAVDSFSGSTLLVRSGRSGAAYESMLGATIAQAVPGVDYVEVRRLETFLEPEIRPWRLGAVMLSMVGVLAIVISLAGVFGVLSQVVALRRREIGVRMALGATRDSIRVLILRLGMTATVAGLAIGFGAVLATSSWLGPLLFETRVADPLVMLSVGLGVLAAALPACLLPAGRAGRVDPAMSLRGEA